MNKVTSFLCLTLLFIGAGALGMDPGKQLIEAAGVGDLERAQRLLGQGVSVDVRDNCRRTPLMDAALMGHEEMCKLLIANKASVCMYDASGLNPLVFAILSGNADVCKLLIASKASVDTDFSGKWVPLHYAACHGHKDVCRVLLENKASVDAKNHEGQTPLHIAASHGCENACRVLLENKASVDAKDNGVRTPLMCAALRSPVVALPGHEDVCRLLIDVQLEQARKEKAAIVTFLGVIKKRKSGLSRYMHYNVAQIVDSMVFEIVRQKNRSVIGQIYQLGDPAKTKWLAYLNQQMNSANK